MLRDEVDFSEPFMQKADMQKAKYQVEANESGSHF